MTERLFVALWLPSVVKEALRLALTPLRTRFPDLRWQPVDRWHITVAFLGDRRSDREIQRFSRIDPPAPGPLELAGGGRFGPILWVGVQADEWLPDLASRVQKELRCPDRRFRGHITIARSRAPGGHRQLARAVAELASFHSPAWTPSELTLVRSTTGPNPAYEVIWTIPLTHDGP